MNRVPLKEIQVSGHSSRNEQPETMKGSHRFWPIFSDGQLIKGDQDHGRSTEVWELGWSNPRQDTFIHHGRVGHSCDG